MMTAQPDGNDPATLRIALEQKEAVLKRAFDILRKVPSLMHALGRATVWITAALDADAAAGREVDVEDRLMVAEFRKVLGEK